MDPVPENCASEVHCLLVKAFDKDPMITTLFSGKGRKKQMDIFFRFLVKKSQLLNEQMFGERVEEQWAVVANLDIKHTGSYELARKRIGKVDLSYKAADQMTHFARLAS